MMLIFHPDKVDVHFKNEDRSIFEEFSKTILRTTKEDLTDQNWRNTTERILYEVNYARGYAKDYEDWSMKCDLLYHISKKCWRPSATRSCRQRDTGYTGNVQHWRNLQHCTLVEASARTTRSCFYTFEYKFCHT